jgi:hypothetical protein
MLLLAEDLVKIVAIHIKIERLINVMNVRRRNIVLIVKN